jgi:hypothetical protein
MANGWTPERRAKQAALIRTWRPWDRSTGPRTAQGKAAAAKNADKGGRWAAEREELRALKRHLSELLKEQRELLTRLRD